MCPASDPEAAMQTSKPTWGDRKATLSASRKRHRSSFSVEWRRYAVAGSRGLYIILCFFPSICYLQYMYIAISKYLWWINNNNEYVFVYIYTP